MWIIEEAAYSARRQRVGKIIVSIERGQFGTSTRFLAEAWGWAHSKARRFLERLEREGMIGTATDSGVTIITVCDYDILQAADTAGGTAPARGLSEKRHSGGTPRGTRSEKASHCESTEKDQSETSTGTPDDTESAQLRYGSGTKQKEGNQDSDSSPSANAKGEAPPALSNEDDDPALIKLDRAEKTSIETVKEMAVIWREVCGDALPVPRGLDKTRIAALRNRYSDTFERSLDRWREFCERVRGSPFLTGDNERGWRADLDFMLKPKNANKLLEGGFDDRKKQRSDHQQTQHHGRQSSAHTSLLEAAAAANARRRQKEFVD
ncbi:hypothetical protein ACW7BJ_27675 [Azospirillum argentinense]